MSLSNNLNKLLKDGISEYNNKNYDEALIIFNKVISIDSNNIDALNSLGVIHGIKKNHEVAIDFFKKVLTINPKNTVADFNLANSLVELKFYDKALEIYKNLEKFNPKNFNIKLNLGNCLTKLKEYEDAINKFVDAININNDAYEPFLNIGIIKQNQNKHNEAAIYFHRVIQLKPDYAFVRNLIGISFNNLGLYSKALENLNKSIEINPKFADAYINLGISLRLMKDFDKAILVYEDAIKKFDNDQILQILYYNLSNVYLDINDNTFGKDYSKALEYASKANLINSLSPSYLNNMGISNLFSSNFSESLINFEKAYQLDPNSKFTLTNLGTVYYHIGDFDKSEKVLRELHLKHPDEHSRKVTFAEILLTKSNFKEGWMYYEYRWGENTGGRPKPKPNFQKPLWNPDLGYNNILVWGEQGIGDQILHGTMLEDFSKKFKKTYLAIDPKLLEFFNQNFPNIEVFSLFEPIQEDFYDYQIPLCSLGIYCRNTIEDFLPLEIPYKIKSNLSYDDKDKRKLRCAISWKSKQGHKSDLKSFDLESLKKLLEIPEIDFYSIQYGEVDKEIDDFFKNHNIKILKPKNIDPYNDIYQLIEFIDSCDFIITSSNTNAHLSGSIGKDTFLILPKNQGKFWYWDNNYNNQNVWYPTIKTFIQDKQGNWSDPIDKLYEFILEKYL